MTTIARPSVESLYIATRSNGQDIASGPGFIVRKNGEELILFTNRHNVRGRRQDND